MRRLHLSEFNHALDLIGDDPVSDSNSPGTEQITQQEPINTIEKGVPFDIKLFAKELHQASDAKGRAYAECTQSISGYSIAHDCILNTVKKILGYPVKSFATSWLPVLMRSTIGTSIHSFIQDYSNQFTELEPSIKVPSIRFSGRIDGIISNHILVEIKSCTYADYQKILKTRSPRKEDFYQAMTYKWILENHLEEAKNPGVKTRTGPPRQEKYEIDTIQLIYVAHDIMASDIEDFGQCLKSIKDIKKALNSRKNEFFFMTSVVLETSTFDQQPYIDHIERKIKAINYYVDANKLPVKGDEFVDTKKCFFCLYSANCDQR